MLSLIFSIYPLFLLSLGNITRLIFLPTILLNFIGQVKSNKTAYKKNIPIIFIIFLIFNTILFIINSSDFLKLAFNNVQIIICFFFAGCSYKLTEKYIKYLTFAAYIISFFVITCFLLKTLGFDVTNLLLISKYADYQALINNPYGPTKLDGFLTDLLTRISYGNSTNMCSFLFLILSINFLLKKRIFKISILFLLVFLIAGSRTYSTLLFILILVNYFKLLNIKITNKKIILFSFFTTVFIFFNLFIYENILEKLTIFLRFDPTDFLTFLTRESERLFYYQNTIDNLNQYFFFGKGPGGSYEFIDNLIAEDKSTDSFYLAMIIDYGFIPTILILLSLIKTTLKLNRYLFFNFALIILGGLVIPLNDIDFFYIYLGVLLNPSVNRIKFSQN